MITRIKSVAGLCPLAQSGKAFAAAQIKYVIEHHVTVNALRRHRMKAWPNLTRLAMTDIRRPIYACKYGRWPQSHARFVSYNHLGHLNLTP